MAKKKLSPQDCPWLGAVEGYTEYECMTEKEWNESGYVLKNSAVAIPMRPTEDADYLVDYYRRESVVCPFTWKITRCVTQKAREKGKLSYPNKLEALEEYLEENREDIIRLFGGDVVWFIRLMSENTCKMFGCYNHAMAQHAANVLFQHDCVYGEPNEIDSIIAYFASL